MQIRGYTHPRFRSLRRTLQLCLPVQGAGGAALAVYHRGEMVADIAAGTRDVRGRPLETDTLCMCMSTSKGVLATLLHVMVDKGMVELDVPVAEYWPEFAQNGKADITMREVAAHKAGLYSIGRIIESAEEMFDWDRMTYAIARMKPLHVPGEDFGYHAWTMGWIIGEVLQRASGQPLPALLQTHLAEPLELDGLYIGLPESELGRVAQVILPRIPRFTLRGSAGSVRSKVRTRARRRARRSTWLGEFADALIPPGLGDVLGDNRWLTSVIPSANGVFNAGSLARLYGALAMGGEIDGVRLISPKALAVATTLQNRSIGRIIPFPLGLQVGYMRIPTLGLRLPMGSRQLDLGIASPHAFGHFGMGGFGGWADPERELGVGLVGNCFGGRIPLDARTVFVATAAARIVDGLEN